MATNPRVIAIVTEGATPEVLDTWVAEGRLPNFARLFAEGTRGDLDAEGVPYQPRWLVRHPLGVQVAPGAFGEQAREVGQPAFGHPRVEHLRGRALGDDRDDSWIRSHIRGSARDGLLAALLDVARQPVQVVDEVHREVLVGDLDGEL